MLVIPPGHGQFSHVFSLTGDSEPMYTTCGFATITGFSAAASLQTLANDIHVLAKTLTSNMCHIDLKIEKTLVKYNGGDAGLFAAEAVGVQAGGLGSAGQSLPPNTSWLVSKTGVNAGRRNRGRMFIPGVPRQDVDSAGFITATRKGLVASALESYRAGLDTVVNLDFLVILHSEMVPPVLPPTRITALPLSGKVATQRRRLR